MNNNPIGVFDSGVGGLSVLRHLLRTLPSERYIYLGDTARVPYGNKSAETVQLYTRQCVRFLEQNNVKLIIIACNTASALALETARNSTSIPVIGVIEPSAVAALSATENGNIGVIGTRATIESKAYTKEILSHVKGNTTETTSTQNSNNKEINQEHINVYGHACPLFVPLAEEGWLWHPATRAIAVEYMKPLIEHNVDTVILGCTHYPLLRATIQEAVTDVQLIDPGEYTAITARTLLEERTALSPQRDVPSTLVEYYVTDIPATFPQVAKQFLGFDVPAPRLIALGGE
jgi:glutamate racemase